MTVDAPRARLRSADRREVLLDAAKELVVERGPAGLTMEGIAARAGVNKALPYRHFENAQAVLVELFVRFNRLLGSRVLASVADHDGVEDRVGAVVAAYFDVVRANGSFLAIMSEAGADVLDRAAKDTQAEDFTTEIVVRAFGVPRREAVAVGTLVQGILATAAQAWGRRQGPRSRIEAYATSACVAVIHEAAR